MSKQQSIIDSFYTAIVDSVGTQLGNRISDWQERDMSVLPMAAYMVITDQDENLLGEGRINNTFIQFSFFGKKDDGNKTLRAISDTLVEDVDGLILSNNMTVKVINKGITIITDVNDQTVNILTEFQIR